MSRLLVVMAAWVVAGCANTSLPREDVALSNYTAGYLAGLRDASHGAKAVASTTMPGTMPNP